MKKTFFTVGPTELYPTVEKHIETALQEGITSLSHRGEGFENIFFTTTQSLKEVLAIPEEYLIFFISSATEAMERVLQNCAEGKTHHFINGAFSERFFEIGKALKKTPTHSRVRDGEGFYNKKEVLPQGTEVACLTHNETSTGVVISDEFIKNIRRNHPDVLIAIDVASSAPHISFGVENVDVLFFSTQKGFGLPAGLGVVAVSPRAMDKSKYLEKRGLQTGSYHTFSSLAGKAKKNQTPETPNVLNIYLLGQVCADMKKRGVSKMKREIEDKKEKLYDFFHQSSVYECFVKDKGDRSSTTLVVETQEGSHGVINRVKEAGFLVSPGYGQYKDAHIRIGNFPSTSNDQAERLLMYL